MCDRFCLPNKGGPEFRSYLIENVFPAEFRLPLPPAEPPQPAPSSPVRSLEKYNWDSEDGGSAQDLLGGREGEEVQEKLPSIDWEAVRKAPNEILRRVRDMQSALKQLLHRAGRFKKGSRLSCYNTVMKNLDVLLVPMSKCAIFGDKDDPKGSCVPEELRATLAFQHAGFMWRLIAGGPKPGDTYVSMMSLLLNDDLSFSTRISLVHDFPLLIRRFTQRRAPHLMSINTALFSLFYKQTPARVEEDLADHFDSLTSQPDDKAPFLQGENSAFYIEWLHQCSGWFANYFDELGDICRDKDEDDYHGVGPSSCVAFLSKIIVSLGTSFLANESLLYGRCSRGAISPESFSWSPYTSNQVERSGRLDKWRAERLQRAASKFPATFPRLLTHYCSAQRESLLQELESANIAAPADDGSGDLEMTPSATAVLGYFLLARHSQIQTNPSPQIPMVLTPKRYLNMAFRFSYILLRASYVLSKVEKYTPGVGCLIYEEPQSHLFQLRRGRFHDFGFDLFLWATEEGGCLDATADEAFSDSFGFCVRPSKLIAALLTSLTRSTSVEPHEALRRQVLVGIRRWMRRYPIGVSLANLQAVILDEDSTPSIQHAAALTFKALLFEHLFALHGATPHPICWRRLLDCLWVTLDPKGRVIDELETVLTMLTVLSDIQRREQLMASFSGYLASTGCAIRLQATLDKLALRRDAEQRMGDAFPPLFDVLLEESRGICPKAQPSP